MFRLAMTSTSTTTSCSDKARAPTETWSSTLLRWWRTTSTRSGDSKDKDDIPPGHYFSCSILQFVVLFESLLVAKNTLYLSHLVKQKIVYNLYLWFCFIWLVFKQLLNFFSISFKWNPYLLYSTLELTFIQVTKQQKHQRRLLWLPKWWCFGSFAVKKETFCKWV